MSSNRRVTAGWLREFEGGHFHRTASADGDDLILAIDDWPHLAMLVRRSGWAIPRASCPGQQQLTDLWQVRADRLDQPWPELSKPWPHWPGDAILSSAAATDPHALLYWSLRPWSRRLNCTCS